MPAVWTCSSGVSPFHHIRRNVIVRESSLTPAVSFLRPCRGSRPSAFKRTTFLGRGDFPQLPFSRLPSAALLLLAVMLFPAHLLNLPELTANFQSETLYFIRTSKINFLARKLSRGPLSVGCHIIRKLPGVSQGELLYPVSGSFHTIPSLDPDLLKASTANIMSSLE